MSGYKGGREHLEQRGELVEPKKAGNGQLLIRMANSFCCFAFSFFLVFLFFLKVFFPSSFFLLLLISNRATNAKIFPTNASNLVNISKTSFSYCRHYHRHCHNHHHYRVQNCHLRHICHYNLESTVAEFCICNKFVFQFGPRLENVNFLAVKSLNRQSQKLDCSQKKSALM